MQTDQTTQIYKLVSVFAVHVFGFVGNDVSTRTHIHKHMHARIHTYIHTTWKLEVRSKKLEVRS